MNVLNEVAPATRLDQLLTEFRTDSMPPFTLIHDFALTRSVATGCQCARRFATRSLTQSQKIMNVSGQSVSPWFLLASLLQHGEEINPSAGGAQRIKLRMTTFMDGPEVILELFVICVFGMVHYRLTKICITLDTTLILEGEWVRPLKVYLLWSKIRSNCLYARMYILSNITKTAYSKHITD